MDPKAPHPDRWSSYLSEIFTSGKPPVLGTVDIKEIDERAQEVLKRDSPAYLYVSGSAGTGSTKRANRKAFDRWKIIPRVLTDASVRNMETTIFGVKYPSPLFVAPIGTQGVLHADGELATARAAANIGVPFIMSAASSRSIEDIAKANGPSAHRWYQLYWPRTADVTLSVLKRVKSNGFTALVVTVDAMRLGWRPSEIKSAFLPTVYGVGVQVGVADPVFMARHGLEPRHETTKLYDSARWVGMKGTWDDIKFLRDNWDGPLVLKGLQSVKDAEKAIEMNVDGIIVSNHGGRQVDGAIASLDALDRICQSRKVLEAQRSGKFTVLFDSGIRTGSDIIKALALGAQGVLIGRPFMYGLAIAGQAGVEQILQQTLADLHVTLGLCGFKHVSDIVGKRGDIMIKASEWKSKL
ncbi:hypothetical protein SERLADRAFT_449858 [Serpula lacrymans var. lacrymans S7.9]|uniref:FMN hydroxy acid dehydrogenase domain-containing protein n=1 Tax=Serpula lacrymans var. lacrymans (strain S7.9) TaxID=578457 RepID=F8P0A1_SERL9|nr:uncharacterized protein SERLADRAFT_449858 [Serpula lacrymans var. lacrymans S7.9]EGO23474.1 hypothetical protein SERLADRAFT_449858 [Serpula lacrymans var. lacrymans S7.9]